MICFPYQRSAAGSGISVSGKAGQVLVSFPAQGRYSASQVRFRATAWTADIDTRRMVPFELQDPRVEQAEQCAACLVVAVDQFPRPIHDQRICRD